MSSKIKYVLLIIIVCMIISIISSIIVVNYSTKTITKKSIVNNSEVLLADQNNSLFDSEYVKYDNTDSGISSTNVEGAIDELYQQVTDYTSIDSRLSILENLVSENAGFHNSIYRGKDVTSYLTATGDDNLYARISSGKFTDLYVGDYFIKDIDLPFYSNINGSTVSMTWRIAGFDLYYNKGDSCDSGTACTVHHAVIVPDDSLGTQSMNTSDVTTGGYVGSVMYTQKLPAYLTAIRNAFGSSHILKYRAWLTKGVDTTANNRYPSDTGAANSSAYYDAYINLMNHVQVTGNIGFSGSGFDLGLDNVQFPLFRLNSKYISLNDKSYWVRDITSQNRFGVIYANTTISIGYKASSSGNVRPFFLID